VTTAASLADLKAQMKVISLTDAFPPGAMGEAAAAEK
jgi:hypothetical protein